MRTPDEGSTRLRGVREEHEGCSVWARVSQKRVPQIWGHYSGYSVPLQGNPGPHPGGTPCGSVFLVQVWHQGRAPLCRPSSQALIPPLCSPRSLRSALDIHLFPPLPSAPARPGVLPVPASL